MRHWLHLAVVVVFFAAACSYGGEPAAKAKPGNAPDGLDGTWELIDVKGYWPFEKIPQTYLIIEGNQWRWRIPFKEFLPGVNPSGAREVVSEIRVRYDPAKKPAAVDLFPGGSLRTDRGDPIPCFVRRKPTLAIYRVRGDVLEVCEGGEGSQSVDAEYPRPSTFSETGNSKQILRVYRRVAASKTQDGDRDPATLGDAGRIHESRIQRIKIKQGHVVVRGNVITVNGGIVKIELK